MHLFSSKEFSLYTLEFLCIPLAILPMLNFPCNTQFFRKRQNSPGMGGGGGIESDNGCKSTK